MKNKKGISLTVLAVTVAILIIVTISIVLGINNIGRNEKLDKLYYDLELLTEKVNMYYWKHDQLPVVADYINTSSIPAEEKNPNDDENYYILDLNALENLSLQTDEHTFIINGLTRTIYIAEGIEIDGKTYYRLPETYSRIYASY
ncbi:MAG: hypothetical protein IKP28_01855 [Clostridia bacterium]|nr:hypothetical protein [Clostridia bacterium]